MRLTALAAFIAVLTGPAGAVAQDKYPSRPITLSHGFGAGGNSDTIARIIAPVLAERLGQQVIVEPRVGAGGNLATDRVAKAAPDGYNLIVLTGGHAVSGALYKALPFHPVDDLQMLSTLIYFPFVISVRKDHRIPVARRSRGRSQGQTEDHHLFLGRRRLDPAPRRRIAGFAGRHRAYPRPISWRTGAGHRSPRWPHRCHDRHADGHQASAQCRHDPGPCRDESRPLGRACREFRQHQTRSRVMTCAPGWASRRPRGCPSRR